jgi:hypothetical protein
MLWVFATAVLTGLLCGCIFRAPALIILSFLSFGSALVLSLAQDTALSAFVTAILVTSAVQLGYLLGAGLCYVLQQLRGPAGNALTLGAEMRRAAIFQPFAPRRRGEKA